MIERTTQPQIKIPKADEKEVVSFSSGLMGVVNKRFEEINQVISSINIVIVLSLIAIIISVIGIFLDQLRFNNVVYKEYSEKIQTLDSIQDTNKKLFEQNSKYQKLIIEQQKEIQKLLNK